MKLFNVLANSIDRNRLIESSEYEFYESHKLVLEHLPFFSKYMRATEAFDLIQANIVIKAMINKLSVESIINTNTHDEVEKVNKLKPKLPHFRHNGVDVYIPFLLPNHNDLYFKTPDKLLTFPYSQFVEDFSDSIIDLFDVYNFKLFESSFASLVYIDKDETTKAYYHANLKVIFIINDQGRADATIHLFDRGIKNIETENIIRRVNAVVKHYYANDKIAFVDALFVNRLISEKLYRRIYKSLKINK